MREDDSKRGGQWAWMVLLYNLRVLVLLFERTLSGRVYQAVGGIFCARSGAYLVLEAYTIDDEIMRNG